MLTNKHSHEQTTIFLSIQESKSPIVGTKLRMLSVMMCQCAIMLWCNVHFVADSWRLQCVRKFRGELQCVMKIPGDYCVNEIYL